jgi:hypothetical protein
VNRAIIPLLLVLLIQGAMVAVVYWPERLLELEPDQQYFATSSGGDVDEIRIGDEFDNEAVLQRAGDRWLLPELAGLPADNGKVASLLEGILPADPGWPVADSAAARQRFQVAAYRYQRRLTLLREGEELDTIYLGTAPSFRKVYARIDAGNAIFNLAFNSFDAPARNDAWLDSRLLQIRGPLSITADAYSVHWRDGDWLSGGGNKPDKRELEALLGALRSLQVEGVADEDDQRELSQTEAELVLQVTSLGGEVILELFTFEGEHFIYSSEHKLFFRLGAYDYDRLTGIDFLRISGESGDAAVEL